ncbi:hypothetical protein P175DRAFT_0429916 [Aspergillus ochraceoroseus IBT 24754]|uniref:Aldehyde dehydrogenase domain-containing protein n=2 Tax=Aspergillus ochraceoroseus TaxID=138278 RepID=A0A2T5M8X1_9EURO|nr:uncharacterized protein P175DRAFT_0429916 [Aspergillus ochraceoroseus IBT 24754]KKK15725.1 hypothetical protein AOCH_002033 [Aspergillus ochraceoroseus]PTU24986.1 hypothetical protein P175DRAFT_0429916 [Aspergillus ochraceoroseus IBT 24754]
MGDFCVTDSLPVTVPLIINGEEVVTTDCFDIVSPLTGKKIWSCSSVSRKYADAAVEAASQAYPMWSATKPTFRRNILLKAADILEHRAHECQEYMSQETGGTFPFLGINVDTSCEILRDLAGRISGSLAGIVPICQDEGTHAMVLREPYGVVLGIAPWNAPYILGIRAIAYALAAGNTCILKGSEVSPRCFWAIGSIFKEAGLPDGCLNVIYHRPEDAAEITTALIEHPAVSKINFTGSTAVGSIIASTAGKNLKPVLLELGGKSSAIVCKDADLQKAAQQCVRGAFLHSGQICMSTERILVHKDIAERFIDLIKKEIQDTHGLGGSTVTLAQPAGVQRNQSLLSDAASQGATLLPSPCDQEKLSRFQMYPAVAVGVTSQMNLYHTESFGASVSLIVVESDEQAISISNDTEYGLSGAVFTEDLANGLSIAKRIKSGAVHINSMTVHDEAGLPHGGVKKSGWGRFNAAFGLDEFLQTKTITFQQR